MYPCFVCLLVCLQDMKMNKHGAVHFTNVRPDYNVRQI